MSSAWTPSASNAEFMQLMAERARTAGGPVVRTDSARNFLDSMAAAGLIEWIKREYVLEFGGEDE